MFDTAKRRAMLRQMILVRAFEEFGANRVLDTPSSEAAAAEQLKSKGIDVEIVDLRSLAPLDKERILTSVAKTKRAAVAGDFLP